jgi:hypothetical protein
MDDIGIGAHNRAACPRLQVSSLYLWVPNYGQIPVCFVLQDLRSLGGDQKKFDNLDVVWVRRKLYFSNGARWIVVIFVLISM